MMIKQHFPSLFFPFYIATSVNYTFTFPKLIFAFFYITIKSPCSIYSLILKLESYRQGLYSINIVLWMVQLTQSTFYHFSNFMTSVMFLGRIISSESKRNWSEPFHIPVCFKLGPYSFWTICLPCSLSFFLAEGKKKMPFSPYYYSPGSVSVLWKLDPKRWWS